MIDSGKSTTTGGRSRFEKENKNKRGYFGEIGFDKRIELSERKKRSYFWQLAGTDGGSRWWR